MRKTWIFLLSILVLGFVSVGPVFADVSGDLANYDWFNNLFNGFFNNQTSPNSGSQSSGTDNVSMAKQTNNPAPVSILTADEDYIFQEVNKERANAGLEPLQIDNRLVQTARIKSQDMIDSNYFDHQSPNLGSPIDQIKQAGISYRSAGENIAMNSSVVKAMQAWMNSPGHRANILNAGYTHIGIGIIDSPSGKMLTQHFIGV